MQRWIGWRLALLGVLCAAAVMGEGVPWNVRELEQVPQSWPAETAEPQVKAVWIAGPHYKGKPTRAYAYYGMPSIAAGAKVPAMVLLHGGGGTAFAEWVRMWNRQGFAAIAIDTVGTVPDKATTDPWNPKRQRHEFSGPAGWGDFANVDSPVADQWTYHAVAVAIGAHSFLRAQPGVDAKRVGLTGISWGGYLTSIVASLDARFRFGVPVYGAGYLGEDSAWLGEFAKLGPERAGKWLQLWDPSRYVGLGKREMLWINGTNDFAYVMPSWQKTYRLGRGGRRLSLQVRMKHSHPDGAKPAEVFAYAKEKLLGGEKMVRVKRQGGDGKMVWVEWEKARGPVKATLCWTRDGGKWQERKWETREVEVKAGQRRAEAPVPDGATAWYLNLTDEAGLVVSAEHGVR